jgi:predicted nucleotidyltransferase
MPSPAATIQDLPERVARIIQEVVESATEALGDSLRSIVLFGSAAENRLRSTSDVNLLIVMTRFEPAAVDRMRPVLQRGDAAVRLKVMWLVDEELPAAAEAFAVKFADVVRRHRVLVGPDPLERLTIPRHAAIRRVRQVLLNLVLRLRAIYALDRDHEERLTIVIADTVGPLRASAAEILDLEGAPAPTAREALQRLGAEWQPARAEALLTAMHTARETRRLDSGVAATMVVEMIELGRYLHGRAQVLV